MNGSLAPRISWVSPLASLSSVPVIANLLEQTHRLLHSVSGRVLEQDLVILGQRGDEDDGCDVVEAVDPLLALVTLTANVVHLEWCAVDDVPEGGKSCVC